MKIRRHYLTLRSFYAHVQEHEALEVTTQGLAETLDCTHRNMVLLLQRMAREGWLSWEPKRGRGNRSVLKFLASKDELILAEAQDIAERYDLQRAISFLHETDDEGGRLRTRFQSWLSGRFGFHSEVRGERRLDLLRFPLPQHIHSLDPADMHYAGESHLVNQLFDGLVRMSADGADILPHLAHAWEVNETRDTWTFFLRKGVLFHHGKRLTAADVKSTFQRLLRLAPSGLFNWVYRDIADIEIPDEQTVVFRLRTRNELFLSFLTTNRASIVPVMNESEDALFGSAPIGTGPFRLADSGHGIYTLEAFQSYFQGRGFLDVVEVWTEPGNSHAMEAVERPAFQVMHNVRLTGPATEQLQQIRQSGMTCKFITVNELRDGPLRSAALREALHLALNRAQVIDRLSGDVIEAADSFWTQPNHQKRDASCLQDSHEDNTNPVSSVREKLAASGYRGESIVLATIPQYASDAELVRDECLKAGIALDIQLIPAEIFKGEARLSADLLLFAVMLDEHRELRLIELFKSMQHHLLPGAQQLMEQRLQAIMANPSGELRDEALRAIEAELASTHRLLFLYRKHLKTAFHPSIRGISLESLGWVRFRDLWFKPDDQMEESCFPGP